MKNEIVKYDKKGSLDVKRAAWSSLSVESQKAYQSDFDLFFSFVDKHVMEITPSDILEYINHLEKTGMKNSTINRKVASLSKMFNILILAGEITKNPVSTLKNMKNISRNVSRQVNISLTIDDIRKVTTIRGSSTEQEKRMSLIIRFLAMTGLRISEMTGIKNADIVDFDKENKKIRIVGKGKKERFSFIDNTLYGEIKKMFPDDEDVEYLFYSIRYHRFNRTQLWRQINQKFTEKIGMDVHPHTLRHFYATYLINVKKRDIKAVSLSLGHSDVSITLMNYVDTALSIDEGKIKI